MDRRRSARHLGHGPRDRRSSRRDGDRATGSAPRRRSPSHRRRRPGSGPLRQAGDPPRPPLRDPRSRAHAAIHGWPSRSEVGVDRRHGRMTIHARRIVMQPKPRPPRHHAGRVPRPPHHHAGCVPSCAVDRCTPRGRSSAPLDLRDRIDTQGHTAPRSRQDGSGRACRGRGLDRRRTLAWRACDKAAASDHGRVAAAQAFGSPRRAPFLLRPRRAAPTPARPLADGTGPVTTTSPVSSNGSGPVPTHVVAMVDLGRARRQHRVDRAVLERRQLDAAPDRLDADARPLDLVEDVDPGQDLRVLVALDGLDPDLVAGRTTGAS